jgi:hypothetical protein
VGFAGTPEFAARALAAIHERGDTIALVLTRPDRPFGRGLAVGPSPVKRFATGHGLPLVQPASLRAAPEVIRLSATAIDVLVVAAKGSDGDVWAVVDPTDEGVSVEQLTPVDQTRSIGRVSVDAVLPAFQV